MMVVVVFADIFAAINAEVDIVKKRQCSADIY